MRPNITTIKGYEKTYVKETLVIKHNGKAFAYVWEKDKVFRIIKIDSMKQKTFDEFAFVLEKVMRYKRLTIGK